MDLKSAFANVSHRILKKALRRFLSARQVNIIDRQWITAKTVDKHGIIYETLKGLHTGMPIAPLLFNMLMDLVDRFCEEKGYLFYRHMDDIALFFATEKEAQQALGLLSGFIDKHIQIPLNTDKCSITKIEETTLQGYDFRLRRKPDGTSKLIIRPAKKNRQKIMLRIHERLKQYRLNKNPHALLSDLRKIIDDWYRAFPASNDRRLIKRFDRWLARWLVKKIFLNFTGNLNARFRHYKRLLGSSSAARLLADLKLSEAEATVKQLLSTGKISEFPLTLSR